MICVPAWLNRIRVKGCSPFIGCRIIYAQLFLVKRYPPTFTSFTTEMNYRYIAIEGNIGAGKSTLANMLAHHYNARLVMEEFADNNFLPKFYAEPERYAFPLELSFLADRYKQLEISVVQ